MAQAWRVAARRRGLLRVQTLAQQQGGAAPCCWQAACWDSRPSRLTPGSRAMRAVQGAVRRCWALKGAQDLQWGARPGPGLPLAVLAGRAPGWGLQPVQALA